MTIPAWNNSKGSLYVNFSTRHNDIKEKGGPTLLLQVISRTSIFLKIFIPEMDRSGLFKLDFPSAAHEALIAFPSQSLNSRYLGGSPLIRLGLRSVANILHSSLVLLGILISGSA